MQWKNFFFPPCFLLHPLVYCSCVYLQTVAPWLIWPVDLHIYFPAIKQPPGSKNYVSLKRVVNTDTANCCSSPKDVALCERTSCWQFGQHNLHLDFITSTEIGHFLRLFVEKPSIWDVEVERKKKICPDLTTLKADCLKINGGMFTRFLGMFTKLKLKKKN
jgi:hypothetical protein